MLAGDDPPLRRPLGPSPLHTLALAPVSTGAGLAPAPLHHATAAAAPLAAAECHGGGCGHSGVSGPGGDSTTSAAVGPPHGADSTTAGGPPGGSLLLLLRSPAASRDHARVLAPLPPAPAPATPHCDGAAGAAVALIRVHGAST